MSKMGFSNKELDLGWDYVFENNNISHIKLKNKEKIAQLCALGVKILNIKRI